MESEVEVKQELNKMLTSCTPSDPEERASKVFPPNRHK